MRKVITFIKNYSKSVFKKRFEKKAFIYVAMGDSAVEGVGASVPHRSFTGVIYTTIRQSRKHVAYHNLGKSGAPTTEVIAEQLDQAIALQPDLVTICVGTNDLRIKSKPSDFAKRLDHIIITLKERTDATIVINNLPDFSHTRRIAFYLKPISRFFIHRYNQAIKDVAKAHKVILVDLHWQSRVYTKHYPEVISLDGFHPSDFGYALWANTILTSISHVLRVK